MNMESNVMIEGVECRLNENGVIELNFKHIAKGLGLLLVDDSGKETIIWSRIQKYLKRQKVYKTYFDNIKKGGLPDFVQESVVYELCHGVKTKAAESFKNLLTDKILPSILKSKIDMAPDTSDNNLESISVETDDQTASTKTSTKNIVNYNYNGSEISFSAEENIMINATQMAKSFEKRPVDWLRFQQSQDFLSALSKVRNHTLADLVQVTKGGNNPGTWMHEDVALEFARWLSPAFAIWCNDRVKELLKTGVATITNDDEAILHAMQVLQKRVEQAKHEKSILEGQIKLNAPKVEYHDKVLQSIDLIPVNLIAKELGMSAVTLNRKLHEMGVIYKSGRMWVLYQKYQDQGYTGTKTRHYTDHGGDRTSMQTYWTEKGRKFIHELMKK
jgi:phage antirepressor YoqD-like protein